MTSETTRYETYQKDSYNFSFGMIGGRQNKYNSLGQGKPSKPGKKPRKQGKPSPQGVTGNNNKHNDDEDDGDDNNNHPAGQSQPPQQGVPLQSAPAAHACAYAAPYPYQCHPPPYPNQVTGYHGDYHVPGYPGSFVPHQGTVDCCLSRSENN
jgi:hypothetical protein